MNKLFSTLLLSFFILTGFTLLPTFRTIQAQEDATSSSEVDPEAVKENIRKRIQEAVDNNSDKILGVRNNIIRGWVGEIESITNDTITISSRDSNRLVSVSQSTVLIVDGDEAEFEDLEIGNSIIAMGRTDENDILNALRVVADDEPVATQPSVGLATITSIDSVEDTIEVSILKTSQLVTLSLVKNSRLTQNQSDEKLTLSDLDSDDKVIVVYQSDSKNSGGLNLIRLHRVNQPLQNGTSPTPDELPDDSDES